MAGLIAIDIFAVVLTVIGFHIAFRQRVVRGLVRQSRPDIDNEKGAVDPLASVFRIIGVMMMAFGITIGVFANLIAHFSATSPNGGV